MTVVIISLSTGSGHGSFSTTDLQKGLKTYLCCGSIIFLITKGPIPCTW